MVRVLLLLSQNNLDCVDCPRGKYAPVALSDACLDCQAGAFTNNGTGSTQCSICNAGESLLSEVRTDLLLY